MSWKPIDGRHVNRAELQAIIDKLPPTTWASGMVLHNTAAPSLAQRPQGLTDQHMENLLKYFRDDRGWSSGPHAFIDDQASPYHLFTRFTDKGTHSPSWNGTKIGIEMLGDFSREDDDSGRGLKVKLATVALFGMLHTKYGWDPQSIKLHKEDPRTTHDCPGKDIDKAEFISLVEQYMGHAGEHPPVLQTEPKPVPTTPPKIGTVNVPAHDTLNMRENSSASSPLILSLPLGQKVTILSEAMNGPTRWLNVATSGKTGWVAARYVKE